MWRPRWNPNQLPTRCCCVQRRGTVGFLIPKNCKFTKESSSEANVLNRLRIDRIVMRLWSSSFGPPCRRRVPAVDRYLAPAPSASCWNPTTPVQENSYNIVPVFNYMYMSKLTWNVEIQWIVPSSSNRVLHVKVPFDTNGTEALVELYRNVPRGWSLETKMWLIFYRTPCMSGRLAP